MGAACVWDVCGMRCPHAHARASTSLRGCGAQGVCSHAECPYLHVAHDARARVCAAFLRGFCPAGARCRRQHLTAKMVKELRARRCLGDAPQGAPVGG
jgi:hypothetical protein